MSEELKFKGGDKVKFTEDGKEFEGEIIGRNVPSEGAAVWIVQVPNFLTSFEKLNDDLTFVKAAEAAKPTAPKNPNEKVNKENIGAIKTWTESEDK